MLSYCNDYDIQKLKEVDKKIYIVRSFLVQMSTLNNYDYIEAFRDYSYRLDKNASETKSTRFLIWIEMRQEKLYWYDQIYSAFLTSSNAFIFPCALSDGTFGLMIWRTRCSWCIPLKWIVAGSSKTDDGIGWERSTITGERERKCCCCYCYCL